MGACPVTHPDDAFPRNYRQATEAIARVRETLEGYQNEGGTMVNIHQVLDLLKPDGMWSYSGTSIQ